MTTAYTSLLGLALPVTGELSGTWGDTVNNSITSLLDSAVAGTTNVSTDADVTLTTTTGAANTAREAILLFSGARTALRTITAPAQSKVYTVINATTGGYSVKLVGAGPTTGVTIVAGESAVCAWNGSDFVKVSNTGGTASFTNVTVTGTTTLSGLTASTALALDASKNVVSVTNTGTGNNVLSASPTLTGTVGGASLTLSSLTSGRVTYAGASGLLQDSANLLYSGTDLTVYGITVGRGLGANANNTAVGSTALATNTSGSSNSAFGLWALRFNTTGNNNTGIGFFAAYNNTTGGDNTAVGYSSLSVNTTGSSNTAIGREALLSNTTASNNTAVGYQAGYSNTTGAENVALGHTAFYSNTTGGQNTVVGQNALYANTTGGDNAVLGKSAMAFNTTGGQNTAIGRQALYSNTTASNNTAVGYQASYSNQTSSQITSFGYKALYTNTTANNSAFGHQALYSNVGTSNAAFGTNTMYNNSSGNYNTAFGDQTLQNNTTASNNTAVGYQAGYSNTTGTAHVAVGGLALYSNTTGTDNVAVGYNSLYSNTTGTQNVSVGRAANYGNSTGSSNTAIGHAALGSSGPSQTGSYNTALGVQALQANTTASYNTAVGYQAGYTGTTGANNTYLGYWAGYLTTTGSTNTFLGYGAGSSVSTGGKNTIIGGYNGNSGGLDIRTASNYIVLSDGDGNPRGYFDSSGYFYPSKINLPNSISSSGQINFVNAGASAQVLATFPVSNQTITLQATTDNVFFNSDKSGIDNILNMSSSGVTAIQFAATQVASANANTLDDYEEGTWTPAISGDSGAAGVTYSTQTGKYTKIGNQVTCWFSITLTSKGTLTGGTVGITGNPFTPAAGTQMDGMVDFDSLATNWIVVGCKAGGFSYLRGRNSAATSYSYLAPADIANNSSFVGSFTYQV